jgi:uncharacterized protein
MSRRQFLHATAIGSAAAGSLAGAGAMPARVLGGTGARVSILTLGAGSRFLSLKREQSIRMLHRALDLGIDSIDTGENYGGGESERRIGEVLRTRRREVFLTTKLSQRGYDGAMRAMERSLKRLGTDCVDLVHIHHLDGMADLARIGARGGAYDALVRIRERKMARFIGISCHSDPEALRIALERHEFDCTLMALNAAQRGSGDAGPSPSFESAALPVAVRKRMGIFAMKLFAQDRLTGHAPPEKLVYYSLSLPVASAVIGMPSLDLLERNVELVRAFQPLPTDEMERLSGELSQRKKAALDTFFSNHADG